MNWETPLKMFNKWNEEFHFTLDPCAEESTAKCDKFYTIEEDGLTKDWSDEVVFVNPPYGKEIGKWVEKCYNESLKGTTIVLLIPARTDTRYFHKFIYNKPNVEIRFLKGRLCFLLDGQRLNPAPFPSMLVIFNNKNYEINSTESRDIRQD